MIAFLPLQYIQNEYIAAPSLATTLGDRWLGLLFGNIHAVLLVCLNVPNGLLISQRGKTSEMRISAALSHHKVFNYLIEYGLGQIQKSSININIGFGTCFQKPDAVLASNDFSLFLANHTLLIHIAFVAQNHFLNIFTGMLREETGGHSNKSKLPSSFKEWLLVDQKTHLIDVAQPFGNIIKAFRVGDIVDEHYSHCTTVIAGGDCVEPFLAGSVPEHQQTNKSPN